MTTVNFGNGNGQRLRDWMTANAGVTLGIPLGGVEGPDGKKEDFLRIGHMGHVNAHMVLGLLAELQAGMSALQIPHGPTGLEAAINVIAEAELDQWPLRASQSRIQAISASCAAMICSASARVSGSSPCSSTTGPWRPRLRDGGSCRG